MKVSLEKIYLKNAGFLSLKDPVGSGNVSWNCPVLIDLIKYWDNLPGQIPLYSSVSFGLDKSYARTTLNYSYFSPKSRNPDYQYFFEGRGHAGFSERISLYLALLSRYFPFLQQLDLIIHSSDSFPYLSGISSSASAIGGLALAVCSLEKSFFNNLKTDSDFFRKASFMARLGSGSASPSVVPGFEVWGATDLVPGSSNEAAISVNDGIHPVFHTYNDCILIISSKEKKISGSERHDLMNGHIFRIARNKQVLKHFNLLWKSLQSGDERLFGDVVEAEAMSLHALMMTSKKRYLLMHPNTIAAINKIVQFRKNHDVNIAFTLDTGANVHVLYSLVNKRRAEHFIKTELAPLCEDGRYIFDKAGKGPYEIRNAIGETNTV